MDPGLQVIVMFLVISSALALVFCIVYIVYGRLWFVAQAEGAPVSLGRILGMPFRRVKAQAVIPPYIAGRKAGLDVSLDALERHYLDGGNVRSVVDGMVAAREAGLSLSFDEARSIDLEGKDVSEAVLAEPAG